MALMPFFIKYEGIYEVGISVTMIILITKIQ